MVDKHVPKENNLAGFNFLERLEVYKQKRKKAMKKIESSITPEFQPVTFKNKNPINNHVAPKIYDPP